MKTIIGSRWFGKRGIVGIDSNGSGWNCKKQVKIKRYYGMSIIGECHTCGMEFGDYKKPRQGYEHALQTGHKVRIEKSVVFHYN